MTAPTEGISIRDVLLVSHDPAWCAGTSERLKRREVRAWRASSLPAVHNALALSSFDAVLFDVRSLPAPTWFQALEVLSHASPAPVIVAYGDHLTPFEGFHLGRFAVRKLLARRPTPDQAYDVLRDAIATPPVIEPHIRAHVGHESVGAFVDRVRTLFFDQAIALCRGHRSTAARLLGVTRQAVQQRVKQDESVAESHPSWPRIRARRKSGSGSG